jgi:hypothetical protein
MLVELKSGETLNGLLVNCDTWMNLTLREVVQTSADGDKFMRLPEIYVRGSTVSTTPSYLVFLALTFSRLNTSECPTRLLTWSRNSRSRTKQIAEVEVGRISGASTGAIAEVEACADVDVAVEEEEAVLVLVAPEGCECITSTLQRLSTHTAYRNTCPVKQLGTLVSWLHPP